MVECEHHGFSAVRTRDPELMGSEILIAGFGFALLAD
jgi:hypothetical protein